MNDIKRMSVKEFRAGGFLQELNRQFLHPLGLAMETIVDEETKEESFGLVWDYRDDPEGMLFAEIDLEKCNKVYALWQEKAASRQKQFGWVVQPPDGGDI
ncbi:MAG: hypothetical protein ACXABY_22925 [Candidatus Thorarchaeota archaeon]|jgi:hypothetical protein